jgi:GH25 family lysozyme M1 (1,4-beta-N-acetylmuramidase)
MTLLRVVALAQALAMILILVPGLQAAGPTPATAAVDGARPSSERAFAAAGSGIGCVVGREYHGPRAPGEPPWPPGTKPTPSPTPSAEPSPGTVAPASVPAPAASPSVPQPSPQAGPEGGTELGATTAYLAASIRVAQAEVTPGSSPGAAATPGDGAAGPSPSPADPGASSPGEGSSASAAPGASSPPGAPTGRGRSPYLTGIDVSHHNGDIDFGKIRSAGYRFVFLKASQDNDFIDPMFATNLAAARAEGLATGGYHFFDYTLDGREQADHFLDRLESIGAMDDALPPVIDVECWPPIGSSIHAVSAARLRDLVERIYERTGRLPIIYTSARMWEEVVGEPTGFEDLPLWAACWGCQSPPTIPAGWADWTFWQTGVDRVRGVGSLDGNYFQGDAADLAALRLRPVSLEGGASVTSRPEVSVDLGGRAATHVRTSSDEAAWSRWTPVEDTVRVQLGSAEGAHSVRVQLRRGPTLKSPVFSDTITLDRSGPTVSEPVVSIGLGPLGDEGRSMPVEVTWQAADAVAGLSDASVSLSCEGHRDVSTEAPGSAEAGPETTWSALLTAQPDVPCRATVVARDGVGNTTRSRSAPMVLSVVAASGDVPAATVEAAKAGIVARRGPDQGRAVVRVDGQEAALIDLYAPGPGGSEVVRVVDLVPGAAHEVTVEPTGTNDPAATGSGITIEGFAVLG